MNAKTETKADQAVPHLTGLALLRAPFPANQISKLPKPTKKQTDEVRADFKKGIRCQICGGWHHPNVVHLDYVGHAALTDRLLDCDPEWNYDPIARDEYGRPILDEFGGMWIKLTVCGMTRIGYGHADGKKGGDAIKEVIGDALRNAAMRFGAALDLWHKGDLHGDSDRQEPEEADPQPVDEGDAAPNGDGPNVANVRDAMKAALARCENIEALVSVWSDSNFKADLKLLPPPMRAEVEAEKNRLKDSFAKPQPEYDQIPF